MWKARTGRTSGPGITFQTTRKPRPETLPEQRNNRAQQQTVFIPLRLSLLLLSLLVVVMVMVTVMTVVVVMLRGVHEKERIRSRSLGISDMSIVRLVVSYEEWGWYGGCAPTLCVCGDISTHPSG